MIFADLIDTDFIFKCYPSEDVCEIWEYDLLIKNGDEEFLKNINITEIEQLKNNCLKLLEAINDINQENNMRNSGMMDGWHGDEGDISSISLKDYELYDEYYYDQYKCFSDKEIETLNNKEEILNG